jgi:hypothetical protein
MSDIENSIVKVDESFASILMFGNEVVARVDALFPKAIGRKLLFCRVSDLVAFGPPGQGGLQAQMTKKLLIVTPVKAIPSNAIVAIKWWASLDISIVPNIISPNLADTDPSGLFIAEIEA